MMKLGKTVTATLVVSALLAALAGCQKQEGPAERAGKEVDKATDKAGQQIEKAGQNIQDAAKGDKK
jgi:predicted small lipoprotein YifL